MGGVVLWTGRAARRVPPPRARALLRAPSPPSHPAVFRVINATARLPAPKNEPVLSHAPGTPERAELQAALKRMAGEQIEIPLLIGGKPVRTGKTDTVRMPHKHSHVLAT